MGGCRFRYEELPAALKAQVDAVLRQGTAKPARPGAAPDGAAAEAAGVSRSAKRHAGGRRQPNRTESGYRVEVLGPRADVAAVHYEGLTVRMANGHRYTPDWVVIRTDGGIECHEVKGAYALHSQGRARLAFDQAREEFPCFGWVWAVKTKHGWSKGGCDGVSSLSASGRA